MKTPISIKRMLLVYLLASITFTFIFFSIGKYLLDKKQVQSHFDQRLLQYNQIIKSIVIANPSYHYLQNVRKAFNELNRRSRQNGRYAFIIWQPSKHRLIHSHGLGSVSNTDIAQIPMGFSNTHFTNMEWRIYHETLDDKQSQSKEIHILTAEREQSISPLVARLGLNNIVMLIWSYPLLGLFFWLAVDFSLASLRRLTNNISNRDANQLDTVDTNSVPTEVRPLVEALNNLFLRLQDAFERNKRFSGDAAHELRTPLAALKTHAQIAAKTDDPHEKQQAIQKVLKSVDRSSHIVDQLLVLSRLNANAKLEDIEWFNLSQTASEIVAELSPQAVKKDIDIELKQNQPNIQLRGNATFIGIMLRNLIDNAIRYTANKGQVLVWLHQDNSQTKISVIDNGPGIAKDLQNRVFERFYRVLEEGHKNSGSGLGLAIVEQIVTLHQAHLQLKTPENGKGLQIDIIFPNKSQAFKLLNDQYKNRDKDVGWGQPHNDSNQ